MTVPSSAFAGIWIWSEPFLLAPGSTTGVLIMDTQGAWDSRMTKEQSATVRGRLEVLDTHGTPRALHATRNAWNALDTTLNAPKRPHCAHKRAG